MVACAHAVRIVEDGGEAVAGSFRELDVAVDDRLEDQFLEVALHLVLDLIGQTQTGIVHRQQETFDGECRIQFLLDNLDGIQQLGDSFERKILTLDRDNHGVRCGQRIDGDQTQRGRAVDEDIVVVREQRTQQLAHHLLAVLQVQHLDFRAHEVDVAGNDIEVWNIRLVDGLTSVHLIDKAVVDGGLDLLHIDAQTAGGVGLRVGIDKQHTLLQRGERGGQVHRRRCLAHTAFLIG